MICFVDTRDTVEFLIILTTSVANGIINAKNNEHLESRIENLPDGRQSLLTEGDEREILRDKCNRVRRDAFESARHAILSYGDRWYLAMRHVAFITYISTSVHERDVREIQIVRKVRGYSPSPIARMDGLAVAERRRVSGDGFFFVIGKYCRVDSWSCVHSTRTGSRPNEKRGRENESRPSSVLGHPL